MMEPIANPIRRGLVKRAIGEARRQNSVQFLRIANVRQNLVHQLTPFTRLQTFVLRLPKFGRHWVDFDFSKPIPGHRIGLQRFLLFFRLLFGFHEIRVAKTIDHRIGSCHLMLFLVRKEVADDIGFVGFALLGDDV